MTGPAEDVKARRKARGARRQAARKAAGITSPEALAEILGVSERTAIRWEQGGNVSPQHREPYSQAILLDDVDATDGPKPPTPYKALTGRLDEVDRRIEKLERVASMILELNALAFEAQGVELPSEFRQQLEQLREELPHE